MRRILSVIFYAISVMFYYSSSLIVCIKVPESSEIVKMLAFFLTPGLIFNAVATFIMGFKNWKRETGIVFITSAAIGGVCILALLFLSYDPGVKEIMPEFNVNYFGNFTSAILYTIMMGFFGSFLYQSGKEM